MRKSLSGNNQSTEGERLDRASQFVNINSVRRIIGSMLIGAVLCLLFVQRMTVNKSLQAREKQPLFYQVAWFISACA